MPKVRNANKVRKNHLIDLTNIDVTNVFGGKLKLITKHVLKKKTSTITSFFKPKQRRGRPKKRANIITDIIAITPEQQRCHKKRKKIVLQPQRCAQKMKETKTMQSTMNNASPSLPPSKKRTNWASPKNKALLVTAIKNWDEEKRISYNSQGKRLSLTKYAVKVNIPYNTFQNYVTVRRQQSVAGVHCGKPQLFPKSDSRLVQTKIVYNI